MNTAKGFAVTNMTEVRDYYGQKKQQYIPLLKGKV